MSKPMERVLIFKKGSCVSIVRKISTRLSLVAVKIILLNTTILDVLKCSG